MVCTDLRSFNESGWLDLDPAEDTRGSVNVWAST